jgi:hypothetical protein
MKRGPDYFDVLLYFRREPVKRPPVGFIFGGFLEPTSQFRPSASAAEVVVCSMTGLAVLPRVVPVATVGAVPGNPRSLRRVSVDSSPEPGAPPIGATEETSQASRMLSPPKLIGAPAASADSPDHAGQHPQSSRRPYSPGAVISPLLLVVLGSGLRKPSSNPSGSPSLH